DLILNQERLRQRNRQRGQCILQYSTEKSVNIGFRQCLVITFLDIVFVTSIDGLAANPSSNAETLALANRDTPTCHAFGNVIAIPANPNTQTMPCTILVMTTIWVSTSLARLGAVSFICEFLLPMAID